MGVKSSQPRSPNLNKTDGHLIEYFRNAFGAGGGAAIPLPPETGMVASGGIINEYTSGTDVYKSHIFNSSGTFTVSSLSSNMPDGDQVDVLVVAGGGGGGGRYHGGGDGAGGFRTSTAIPVTATSYTVTVGGGGLGGAGAPPGTRATSGSPSNFAHPSPIVSQGGGGGGDYPNGDAQNGGSGGGGNGGRTDGALGNRETDTTNPAPSQGNNGGDGANYGGAGGGGAGGVGADTPAPGNEGGAGGNGSANVYAYGPASPQTYAGGGGGATYDAAGVTPSGGTGGGGDGAGGAADSSATRAGDGTQGLGGGGGGNNGYNANFHSGGRGGSGVVVVRYKIGEITAAKASGGAISFYNGKTIHVFTQTGTFSSGSPFNETCECIIIGGGGGGSIWIRGNPPSLGLSVSRSHTCRAIRSIFASSLRLMRPGAGFICESICEKRPTVWARASPS